MTGVSLRHRGIEHLALPGGLDALRSGATLGLPLLAPWANRLSEWRYTAAGIDVDLGGMALGVDSNGLPIHGLLVGRPGWRGPTDIRSVAALRTSRHQSMSTRPPFPFHTGSKLAIAARGHGLTVDTTVRPTAQRFRPGCIRVAPLLPASRDLNGPAGI